jgi:D-glycero-alpha-D-manno-heptose-7-phosphate kinase
MKAPKVLWGLSDEPAPVCRRAKGESALIIVRTPLRLSFFGNGHARSPALTATIDQYVYVQLRALPAIHDYKYRVVWDHLERAHSAADLKQPIARALFQYYGSASHAGYDVIAGADLPAHAGFGANSSFTVSMLHAFLSAQGQTCSKRFLASEAIRFHRDLLNDTDRTSDHAAVAFGGFNRIAPDQENDASVTPVKLSDARTKQLAGRLLLLCAKDDPKNENVAKYSTEQNNGIGRIAAQIEAAQKILEDESADLDEFGRLLHEARPQSRAPSAKPSDNPLDRLYDAAIGAGALGGKLLGGGRAWLFYVSADNAKAVQTALRGYTPIPFSFEQAGAAILFQS